MQPTSTINLNAQLETDDPDGMPKKGRSSSAPLGNKVQSLWDNDFDAMSFVQMRLDFSLDFPNDHHMVAHMGARQMSNVLETHMLRGFLIERAMFEAYCQSDKLVADLKVQLNTQREVAIEAQKSLTSLTIERDRLKEYKKNKNKKAKKLKEELVQVRTELLILKEYAKAEALLKNMLEENLVAAQNDIVALEDRAFEKAKAQMACLYPDLDLSKLDLFKVVKDGHLVDEEDLVD